MTDGPGTDFQRIIEAAREHYQNLKTDIANASTRIEHVRLTALATEAHNLLTELSAFNVGLVYTHTAAKVHEQILEEAIDRENQLDLPEFKSPFDPRHHVQ